MSEIPIELKPIGASKSKSKPKPPPRHPATAAHNNDNILSGTDSGNGGGTGSLGRAYKLAEDKARASVHLQEGGFDVVSVYGLVVASWSALLALPLLLFPRILLFFAQVPPTSSVLSTLSHEREREEHYDTLTPLENYLCLSLSLGLISLSLISLLVLVPSYESPTSNPSRTPLLGILVGLFTITSIFTWNTSSIGGLATALALGHTLVALWGWWVVVFGAAGSKLVKKGKDKKDSKIHDRFKKL